MTENEAIKVLNMIETHGPLSTMAKEMSIKALEKQISKNPIYNGYGYTPDGTFIEWICPCCGNRFQVEHDYYDYCPDCGQKLDWSDGE